MTDTAQPAASTPEATIDSIVMENPLRGVKWAATDLAWRQKAYDVIQAGDGKTKEAEAQLALLGHLVGMVLVGADPRKSTRQRLDAILRANMRAGAMCATADAAVAIRTGKLPLKLASMPPPTPAQLKILAGLGTSTVQVEINPK